MRSSAGQIPFRQLSPVSTRSSVDGADDTHNVPSKLEVRQLPEAQYDTWTKLVSKSAAGTIYNTPEYLDCLCSAAGGSFRILAAERHGELVGGIAVYEQQRFWGKQFTGRLLLYYNGIVEAPIAGKYPSEVTAQHTDMMSALEAALRLLGCGRIQIRNRHPFTDARVFISKGWRVIPSYSYEVALNSLDATWARMEHNLHRLVRRSEREHLQFSEDDDFDSFYKLHEQTHQRKKVALYLPRKAFEQYFRRLYAQGMGRLFHARLSGGRAVSSQLVLCGPHAVSHTVAAATDAEYLQLGATAFLRWKAFETLAQLGFLANDLTDATLNPVTHFKSQLGGDLKMNLVLEYPESMPFTVERMIRRSNQVVRSVAKAAVGPALRRFGH